MCLYLILTVAVVFVQPVGLLFWVGKVFFFFILSFFSFADEKVESKFWTLRWNCNVLMIASVGVITAIK